MASVRELLGRTFPLALVGKGFVAEGSQTRAGGFYDFYKAEREQRGYLNMHEAAALLGLRQNVFRASFEAGLLPPTVSGVRGILFRRGEVSALRDRIGHRATYTLCGNRFGLSNLAIEQLAAAQLIQPLHDPLTRSLAETPHVDMRSADELFAELKGKVIRGQAPADAITLGEAMRGVGGRDKPWAAVISAALRGELKLWQPTSEEFKVSDLHLDCKDLGFLLSLNFDRRDYPNFPFMVEYNTVELMDYLNISLKTRYLLLNRGFLMPRRTKKEALSPASEVMDFGGKYASIREVKVRLFLPTIASVWPELWMRGLSNAIGSHHWLRSDVEDVLNL